MAQQVSRFSPKTIEHVEAFVAEIERRLALLSGNLISTSVFVLVYQ
jgi:hypothetical protein